MTASSSAQKDDAAPRPPLAAAPAPPPQQQHLSAKIAGFGVSPNMINALARSDGGFSPDGFGAGGDNGQPQDLMHNTGLLKPVTVDALNTQHFSNYLTSARSGMPSAVTQMVNIQLQRNINAKVATMTLQLEPADLGLLDIRLTFDKKGGIRAHLTVDKPETLTLLQKDSHHLEKVLQQSGLDLDENALSFDLRDQRPKHDAEGFNDSGTGDSDDHAARGSNTAAEKEIRAQMAVQANGYITRSGVNIII